MSSFRYFNYFFHAAHYVLAHPKVRTQYGIIEGKVVNTYIGPNTKVEQFLGIPYALPPIGDRRFEYPKPREKFVNGKKHEKYGLMYPFKTNRGKSNT